MGSRRTSGGCVEEGTRRKHETGEEAYKRMEKENSFRMYTKRPRGDLVEGIKGVNKGGDTRELQ